MYSFPIAALTNYHRQRGLQSCRSDVWCGFHQAAVKALEGYIFGRGFILPSTPLQEGPSCHTVGISLLQHFQAFSSPSPLSYRKSMPHALGLLFPLALLSSVLLETWMVRLRLFLHKDPAFVTSCRFSTKDPILYFYFPIFIFNMCRTQPFCKSLTLS